MNLPVWILRIIAFFQAVICQFLRKLHCLSPYLIIAASTAKGDIPFLLRLELRSS
jgi:hypothetical protein